jgi:hypothetical protein
MSQSDFGGLHHTEYDGTLREFVEIERNFYAPIAQWYSAGL